MLNRVIQRSYPSDSSRNISYLYDEHTIDEAANDATNAKNPITQKDVFAYAADSNRLASVNGQTFKQDAAGNILVRDLTNALTLPAELRNKIECTYDVTNRMTSASVNGSVQALYSYNAFGRRVV